MFTFYVSHILMVTLYLFINFSIMLLLMLLSPIRDPF